jgi:hypothetical protein
MFGPPPLPRDIRGGRKFSHVADLGVRGIGLRLAAVTTGDGTSP